VSFVNSPYTWTRTLLGNPPVITSLSPDTKKAGGVAFTLTIQGEGFQHVAVVNWSGTNLSTTYDSSNQLTAQVSAGLISAPAYILVTVTSLDQLVSDPVIFTLENTVPTISGLFPDHKRVGSDVFAMTDIGNGFVGRSQIVWEGAMLETIFVDRSHLLVDVLTEKLTDAKRVVIVIKNPEPGESLSNKLIFNIERLRL
jgi:hypothetical protein